MDTILVEESLRELYENAPCGYLSSRVDGTIIGVNQTFLTWTGYTKEDLVNAKRIPDLLTVPGKIFYETQFSPLLQMQGSVKEIALDIVCKNDRLLPVLANSTQREPNESRPAVIFITFLDATDRRRYERDLLLARQRLEEEVKARTAELLREIEERKRAEGDLRTLTSKLLQLRDDERRQIARELHDSVGQMLMAVSMNAKIIETESANLPPKAALAASENAKWIADIFSEIRTISHLLHPPLLDEVGLISALTWYVEGLAKRAGMTISLEIPPDLGRLPDQLELSIFRIVQECLTNVHRHSGSKRAAVRLLCSADTIRVEVQDEGASISEQKLTELRSFGSGVGLRGMRERAKQLGGEFEISSGKSGTLVAATFVRSEN